MKYLPIFVLLWLGMGSAAWGVEKSKVSLRLQWLPQAQFAGYYVAKEKGYYDKLGLDVEIRAGGPGINPLANVQAKKDDFATELLTSAVTFGSGGAPIVNIAQLFQTTALMLLSHKSSGIVEPRQMAGKKVGVWPGFFQIPVLVLLKKSGVTANLVKQGFDMDAFLRKDLDVASAMVYNEYHVVLESGVKAESLNRFYFKDFGLNIPDDGLYVHRDYLAKNPEICKNFVKATIMGWLTALESPDEAVDLVMKEAVRAKTGTTREHQLSMLKEVGEIILYRFGKEGIGKLDPESLKFVNQVLKENGLAKKEVAFDAFYRPLYQSFDRKEFTK